MPGCSGGHEYFHHIQKLLRASSEAQAEGTSVSQGLYGL